MKVTASLIAHRPERVLYYLPEISDEINRYIAEGECPDVLKRYRYAFGTYDEVGIFYLPPSLQKETGMQCVMGIEYRKDDDRIDLPETLASVVLPACDIIMLDVAYAYQLNNELLNEIVCCAKKEKHERSEECKHVEDGIVTVFHTKEKLCILYEIELVNEGKYLSDGDFNDYSKAELFERAYREPITECHNWTWLWERLRTYYRHGINDYAFVHFDIKDFKMINELYNHQIANAVLKNVARNMDKHQDWIYYGARCHNDNFAMMIRDMPEEETRRKLEGFFGEVSRLDADPTYKIYYRCGVVGMRNSMRTGDTVADCAKLAQSMGKELNVTEINYYTNEMHEDALWGKQLKAYLDTAIRANEFLVYLQPKFDVRKECICGAEALVRWNYKHREFLPPFRFIPYFESDDSIIKVDDVVLHKVCAKLREWKDRGDVLYPISVNLSRKHMEQPRLVSHLVGIVDSYGVDHSLIEFELTESAAYDNQQYMVSIMNDLKDKGFLISMDDFGTGYSSFSLLKEMPIDTLKIDKSFVDPIIVEEESEKSHVILRHIISMAKELGIRCIAEGVEEYAQVLALQDLGCETVQGYYYSKPIPMESFEEKYIKALKKMSK